MVENRTWLERRQRVVANGIASAFPLFIDHAEGAWVTDVEGNRYLDFIAGIGVQSLGHNRPEVVEAIQKAASSLIHTSFHTVMYPRYVTVAERLVDLTPGDMPKRVLFVNSGAEAIENAFKIARQYTGRPGIVSFTNGFHGRTFGALSATDKARPYKIGFAPFLPDVYRLPSPYCFRCALKDTPTECHQEAIDAVEAALVDEIGIDQVAAMVIEPVQGEGGFIPIPKSFLAGLRRLCDQYGILLIDDEIQAGLGRTGKLWAIQHAGVVPDLLVSAKALGGGLPLSAVVGRAEILDAVAKGSIGSTYGGNPVALAAAEVVLDLMIKENVPEKANQIGSIMRQAAAEWQQKFPQIGDVRALGAMMALEFVRNGTVEPDRETCQAVIQAAFRHNLLLTKAGLEDNVIRLLPPLTISRVDLQEGLSRLAMALQDVVKAPVLRP